MPNSACEDTAHHSMPYSAREKTAQSTIIQSSEGRSYPAAHQSSIQPSTPRAILRVQENLRERSEWLTEALAQRQLLKTAQALIRSACEAEIVQADEELADHAAYDLAAHLDGRPVDNVSKALELLTRDFLWNLIRAHAQFELNHNRSDLISVQLTRASLILRRTAVTEQALASARLKWASLVAHRFLQAHAS